MNKEAIAVDLDGTLATWDGYKGPDVIGEPIKPMVDRVKEWIKDGRDVRIFTARVANDDMNSRKARIAIQSWCKENIGKVLPITAIKDPKFGEYWDDRAVAIERNTGMIKNCECDDEDDDAVDLKVKDVKDVICCVVDYGTFACVAEKLAQTFKKVYYHTPCETEFLELSTCIEGFGMKGVEKLEQILDPDVLPHIDLFVFPDRGFGGLQRHLRELGKPVWGSMDVYQYEDSRTKFIKMLDELDLPHVKSETIKGVSDLCEHLEENTDKYVKLNRYRENMETWKHRDMVHSKSELNRLKDSFGGAMDLVTFVVQDCIKTDIEIGYDGFCVDGEYPETSFGGYELKDELYLGTWQAYDDLPKQVKEVNEALSPMLKDAGYRNFLATEIRVKDGKGFFIDPTFRMPGLTGEHQMETCINIAEIMWKGAHGELVQPKFSHKFAAQATIHYTDDDSRPMVIKIPDNVRKWIKLWHFYEVDGYCHFFPRKSDNLGVVIGVGNTIEEALDHLKENFDELDGEPVKIRFERFSDIINSIDHAQKNGMKFSDKPLPKIETIVK